MLSKDTRFARYSRAFCWLLASIWLVLGLFLMTSPRSSEAFTGVLWILGAGVFSPQDCICRALSPRG